MAARVLSATGEGEEGGNWAHTCLSGGIEAQHQQPHLLGSEDLGHGLGYGRAHGDYRH